MRFQTLQQWLDWQEGLHGQVIDLGLERVRAVWQNLDHDLDMPVITVAGTNGKGSSVAMLEAIYLAASYRVGSYTSPHLLRYNERIRIQGEPVADELLCDAFACIDEARGDTSLTYFEFGTLAALQVFARSEAEVIVLEVGLGGRLDAVNIIDADVALITAIDVDHVAWLGDDREQIGREKAGIMRTARPVVISDSRPPGSLAEESERLGAQAFFIGSDYRFDSQEQGWSWHYGDSHRSALPEPALRGRFQLQNAAGVMMVLQLLHERLPCSMQAIRQGLQQVQLPGRFQYLGGAISEVLDVAHNPQSARALAENLQALPLEGRRHAVVGMLADKDIEATLAPLREAFASWHLAPPDAGRAADTEQLLQALGQDKEACFLYENITAARVGALNQARPGDQLVIFGSFYTVAEALHAHV